ncbi:4971_t:CDS:1, partial [Cetraspora pellucida]
MTSLFPTSENSDSEGSPILSSTQNQMSQPPLITQQPISQPPRTQTPDSVVSTYTLQQKQSIIASTAKLEQILQNKNKELKTWKDNYNTLLQQLGEIAPTVEKA